MTNNRFAGRLIRTAATFVAAVFLICTLGFFTAPAKTVNADVGQPDIPVPALSDVHCASYCVYDKTTGYIVISMNPDERIYPASMTKIMTCLLSLELLDTSAKIEVTASALAGLGADSSLMGVLEGEKLVGIITDGDLRRHMGPFILESTAADLMTHDPICIEPDALSAKAEGIMEQRKITCLFVVDNGYPIGVLTVHDL